MARLCNHRDVTLPSLNCAIFIFFVNIYFKSIAAGRGRGVQSSGPVFFVGLSDFGGRPPSRTEMGMITPCDKKHQPLVLLKSNAHRRRDFYGNTRCTAKGKTPAGPDSFSLEMDKRYACLQPCSVVSFDRGKTYPYAIGLHQSDRDRKSVV